MMSNIAFRNATINDLALLQHWDKQEHTVASDPNDDWNWEMELPRNPPWREQLIAELDGNPIGFVQIIDPLEEETHYWEDVPPNYRAIDIWIGEKENLGKGYGTIMMQLALERCFKLESVEAVLVDPLQSNIRAHRFYERQGFKFMEKRRFEDDDCLVYRLSRKDWLTIKNK